jgi:hypothetical protein
LQQTLPIFILPLDPVCPPRCPEHWQLHARCMQDWTTKL